MKASAYIDSILAESSKIKQRNESYYWIMDATDPPELEKIMRMWADKGMKAMDRTKKGQEIHGWYSMRDVWPYREYEWERETSRSGYVSGELLDGPEKWDALVDVMASSGWSAKYPIEIIIGRNGKAKVGEGNHRLAAAREAGIRRVPVVFTFWRKTDGHRIGSARGPLKNVRELQRKARERDKEREKKEKERERKRKQREKELEDMDPEKRAELNKQVQDIMKWI